MVVEDAHWLDPLSRDLLESLVAHDRPRAGAVAGHHPPGRHPSGGTPARPRQPRRRTWCWNRSDAEASAALVRERHRALVGSEPDPEVLETIVGRAEGNAFYLEQLVDYVLAHAAREDGTIDPDALELPPSLHSLVLSRIDAQPEGPRRAVGVASVIGRAFRSPLVAAAYPDLGPEPVVHGDLVTLAGTRLIDLEDPEDKSFAFGHAVTRDVAYDSLPFSVRSLLHGRVGGVLEDEPDGPRRHLDLLAYHFSHSDDLVKKRHYLGLAAAAARAAYANEAAITYLEELLPLVGDDERNGVLLELAEALEVRGDWAAAEEAVSRAREAAEAVGDAAGRGPLPHRHRRARPQAGAVRRGRERAGRCRGGVRRGRRRGRAGPRPAPARHLGLAAGTSRPGARRRTKPASPSARRSATRPASRRCSPTSRWSPRTRTTSTRAERLGQEGLERRRALGRPARGERLADQHGHARDQSAASWSWPATGSWRRRLMAEEVGDPWVVAVGRHNLGNVTRDLGDLDAAAGHFAAALGAYVERDDLWSLAHLFEDVAVWILASGPAGDAEAVSLLAASERLREEIGAPRLPADRGRPGRGPGPGGGAHPRRRPRARGRGRSHRRPRPHRPAGGLLLGD